MGNGSELTAAAMRDWCRFSEVDTVFIEPGSPWQNGYCESFNGRFRDEFLSTEQFNTLLEAQVLAEDWRIEYNTERPHGSLGGHSPGDRSLPSGGEEPPARRDDQQPPAGSYGAVSVVRSVAGTPPGPDAVGIATR